MQIDLETGLLIDPTVRYIPSPNCSQRPEGVRIDLLVIHNISLPPGEFGGPYIEAFFTNALVPSLHPYFKTISHLKVSCHCFINRTGQITQYVPFSAQAWHAGVSTFEGRDQCNDFSIGIELEGTDEIPYTQSQYIALAKLVALLQNAYPGITWERIVGHSTIAPTRKTDPGPLFDWKLLANGLNKLCKNNVTQTNGG
jgi:AmpD protein